MKTCEAPAAARDSTPPNPKTVLASSGRPDPEPSISEHTPRTKPVARLENKVGDLIRQGSAS
jgi:hypothetical protein